MFVLKLLGPEQTNDDSDDDDDDDLTIEDKVDRSAIRDMNLFSLATASMHLVPHYGTGESVAYSVKSKQCSVETVIEIYTDMVCVSVLCVISV